MIRAYENPLVSLNKRPAIKAVFLEGVHWGIGCPAMIASFRKDIEVMHTFKISCLDANLATQTLNLRDHIQPRKNSQAKLPSPQKILLIKASTRIGHVEKVGFEHVTTVTPRLSD